jgi:phage terminase small subunit
MGRRLTEKQARFLSEYLENGGQAAKAYRIAYPGASEWSDNAVRVEACRLLKNPLVRTELDKGRESIEELTKAAVERVTTTVVERVASKALVSAQITADVILAELEAAYRVAEASGNAAAMVQASLGRAKVAGLLVERTENKNLTATVTPADQAPDLAGIWAKVAVTGNPEPEIHLISHQSGP